MLAFSFKRDLVDPPRLQGQLFIRAKRSETFSLNQGELGKRQRGPFEFFCFKLHRSGFGEFPQIYQAVVVISSVRQQHPLSVDEGKFELGDQKRNPSPCFAQRLVRPMLSGILLELLMEPVEVLHPAIYLRQKCFREALAAQLGGSLQHNLVVRCLFRCAYNRPSKVPAPFKEHQLGINSLPARNFSRRRDLPRRIAVCDACGNQSNHRCKKRLPFFKARNRTGAERDADEQSDQSTCNQRCGYAAWGVVSGHAGFWDKTRYGRKSACALPCSTK